jgi:hypothetical protein
MGSTYLCGDVTPKECREKHPLEGQRPVEVLNRNIYYQEVEKTRVGQYRDDDMCGVKELREIYRQY